MAEVCIQPNATQQLQMYVLPPCNTPLLSVLSSLDKLEVCVNCCVCIWFALHTGCAVLCRRLDSPGGVTLEQAAKHNSHTWSTRHFWCFWLASNQLGLLWTQHQPLGYLSRVLTTHMDKALGWRKGCTQVKFRHMAALD